MRTVIFWLIVLAIPITLPVIVTEFYLRAMYPHEAFDAGRELIWMRTGRKDAAEYFLVDPDLGFRPKLDTPIYDRYGAVRNEYDPYDRKGRVRLLFLGDSVTRRGKIIVALRELYGDQHFEYWNAGVESFNAIQEIIYYRRHVAPLEPDHVILALHNNDIETTPIAFINKEGRLEVYAPNLVLGRFGSWLFVRSLLYRRVLTLFSDRAEQDKAIVEEIRTELSTFSQELVKQGTKLSVVLLPILDIHGQRTPREIRNYRFLKTIVSDLDLRFFDLTKAYQAARECGLPVQQSPGDRWHPSQEVSNVFALYLYQEGLLTEGIADDHGGMPDLTG